MCLCPWVGPWVPVFLSVGVCGSGSVCVCVSSGFVPEFMSVIVCVYMWVFLCVCPLVSMGVCG